MKADYKCEYCSFHSENADEVLLHESNCRYKDGSIWVYDMELIPADQMSPESDKPWEVVIFRTECGTANPVVYRVDTDADEGDQLPRWRTQCKNTNESIDAGVRRLVLAARNWLGMVAAAMGTIKLFTEGINSRTIVVDDEKHKKINKAE